jgi:hypothetical protein
VPRACIAEALMAGREADRASTDQHS